MLRPPFVVAREVCVLSGGAACPITPSGKGSRFGQLVRAHARPLRLHRAAQGSRFAASAAGGARGLAAGDARTAEPAQLLLRNTPQRADFVMLNACNIIFAQQLLTSREGGGGAAATRTDRGSAPSRAHSCAAPAHLVEYNCEKCVCQSALVLCKRGEGSRHALALVAAAPQQAARGGGVNQLALLVVAPPAACALALLWHARETWLGARRLWELPHEVDLALQARLDAKREAHQRENDAANARWVSAGAVAV